MEITIRHVGGVKFEASTRGHKIYSDQPASNGGTDSAFTPPELLLAALGTCAGYYAVEYLRVRGLQYPDLKIRVTAEKATQPARLAAFHIFITTTGIPEAHQAGIARAVKACLIHNTLVRPSSIELWVGEAEPLAA